jgi:hypothetical protein
MAIAAIDRLVHHATILEMNVDSYRRHAAAKRRNQASVSPTTSDDNLDANPHEADADNLTDNKEDTSA